MRRGSAVTLASIIVLAAVWAHSRYYATRGSVVVHLSDRRSLTFSLASAAGGVEASGMWWERYRDGKEAAVSFDCSCERLGGLYTFNLLPPQNRFGFLFEHLSYDDLAFHVAAVDNSFQSKPPPGSACEIVHKLNLRVPFWFLIALVGGAVSFHRLRRAAPPPGHCRRCGYDLRATPTRCPECGHAPAMLQPAAIAP